MGKLNIAHHKSYHPYRLDNIERVRRDQEEARRKEQGQEDRIRLADSEARLELLRTKSYSNQSEPNIGTESRDLVPTNLRHINLFADFEQQELAAAIEHSRLRKQKTRADEELGIPLAPSARDLKPWYIDAESCNGDLSEHKKMKDLSFKAISDPLTSIKHQLTASHPSSQEASTVSTNYTSFLGNTSDARIHRETKERVRALELIRKRRKEKESELSGGICMTPNPYPHSSGYGDVYNPRETEEAHRRWDKNGTSVERDKGKRNKRPT